MKIKEVSIGKEFKAGLPNFSNITVRADIKFEVKEDEQVNWNFAWDEVNRQLSGQVGSLEPSWIKTQEFNKFFKVTFKVQKEKHGN